MALREEFEAAGNWLFRWRSFLPVFLVAPTVVAIQHADCLARNDPALVDPWGLLCLAVTMVGLAIRIFTVGYAPQGTSGRNTKDGQIADTLNSTGTYSLVRHPLYLGNFIIWIGISMFAMIWWLTAIYMLAFWLYYERIMFAEEEFLRRKFGDTYLQWASITPAFIPKLTGWRNPALGFSLRSVLRREYPGVFGITACFFALSIGEGIVVERRLVLNPLWWGLFLLGAVVFLILRTLKHRTRVLLAHGR